MFATAKQTICGVLFRSVCQSGREGVVDWDEALLLECRSQTEQLFEVYSLWRSSIENRCVCVCVCKIPARFCWPLSPAQLMRMSGERPSSSFMFLRLFSSSSTVLGGGRHTKVTSRGGWLRWLPNGECLREEVPDVLHRQLSSRV